MVRNRWLFAVGIGIIVLGALLFVKNDPPGDMFWEWPSFAFAMWIAGIVTLGMSIKPKKPSSDS